MTGDDVDQFRAALDGHAGDADLIITTGGVSAGARTKWSRTLSSRWAGDIRRRRGGRTSSRWRCSRACHRAQAGSCSTPIITLPGNPVSALVSFEVFIRAPLREAMGLASDQTGRAPDGGTDRGPDARRAASDSSVAACSTPTRAPVTSYGPPASHHLRWLASANCLLEIEEEVVELAAGSPVQVWTCQTGSHP